MHRLKRAWQRVSRGFVLSLMLLGATEGQADDDAADTPAARFSAAAIRKGLLENLQRIQSLRVTYRSYGYDTARFPPGTYLHRIVSVKAPYSLYHLSAHGHDLLSWDDDSFQQRAYVTKDRVYNEFPVNRCYFDFEIKPEDGLPGTLPGEFFFHATGLWPLSRTTPRPDGHPYMLNEIAVSADYSHVRDKQERVGGRWCHVLEKPGIDRLWLDAERGFALLARETYSYINGGLVQRLELSDHKEFAPGIWIPARMRNTQYDWRCPDEAGRKRVVIDATHKVLDAHVNDIDDDVFQFKPLSGALFDDGVNSSAQTQPGGVDHLDHLVSLWTSSSSGSVGEYSFAGRSSKNYWLKPEE